MTAPHRPTLDALLPAMEQCPVSVVITNRLGEIEYVNPWFTKTSGYERDEVLGRNPRFLKSGVTTTGEYAQMFDALLKKQVWRGEFCNRRKDGMLFWESVVMVPVLSEAGEITHFMALKEDVTVRKTAERSESSLMSLLRLCNESASRDELLQGVVELFQWRTGATRVTASLDLPSVRTPKCVSVGAWVEGETPAQSQQYLLVHKSEQFGRIELEFGSPVQTSEGEKANLRQMASTVAVALAKFAAEDARLRAEQRSRDTQKMEALGQLAGGIAHDYNNILTATLLHLALAREMPELPARIRGTLVELEAEAKRAARLTRQLLLFSRRQLGCLERIELRTVVEQLLTMLKRVIGEQVTLQFADSPADAWIDGDVSMVEQVIVNLCINARDALGSRGGFIALRVSKRPGPLSGGTRPGVNATQERPLMVCLTVSDSGCGMDAQTKARVFEPFFTTKAPGHGTGLGLATVYGIVERHHGVIECDSELGVGTEFRVFFPAKEPMQGPKVVTRRQQIGISHRPLVLLVEDDPMVRAMGASALRLHGCEVLDVPDGKAALEIWARVGPKVGLLMTDLILPGGMSGREVIEHCRRDRPDLPAVLTSGHFDARTSELLNEIGRVTFLPKPFEFAALVDVVSRTMQASNPEGEES
ncbi:ATP-binding protein [Nibricoccus sp. IMCC34717]|uniref:ATP-binding protein n=1 Tax=Nibricoccus sp. IMCC34717 TaxID=3034021 RepID=UPI0038507559